MLLSSMSHKPIGFSFTPLYFPPPAFPGVMQSISNWFRYFTFALFRKGYVSERIKREKKYNGTVVLNESSRKLFGSAKIQR